MRRCGADIQGAAGRPAPRGYPGVPIRPQPGAAPQHAGHHQHPHPLPGRQHRGAPLGPGCGRQRDHGHVARGAAGSGTAAAGGRGPGPSVPRLVTTPEVSPALASSAGRAYSSGAWAGGRVGRTRGAPPPAGHHGHGPHPQARARLLHRVALLRARQPGGRAGCPQPQEPAVVQEAVRQPRLWGSRLGLAPAPAPGHAAFHRGLRNHPWHSGLSA